MYKIKGWYPVRDQMSGCSFNIVLTQEWKDAVSQSGLNQEKIDNLIHNMGADILKNHGYGKIETDPKFWLRVKWGEWGCEHISVPGNACGLDIDTSYGFGVYEGEVSLSPHNVDSINQASMILTLFLKIADVLESEVWQRKDEQQ